MMGSVGEQRPATQSQKTQFSKAVVVVMILTLLTFTGAVLWLSWLERHVPDSLIVSVFGAITGELGILGWIRTRG